MTMTHTDEPQQPGVQISKEAAVSLAAGVLVLIGGAMQFATVSVASGAVIVFGGFLLAAIGDAKVWLTIVALIVTGLCVLNVVSTEHQLDQRRQEISNIFGS